ncbi:TMEM62 [Cordylochernes scorpioides]|uniref:TMEM62 n=1 Tax=Cordylochernes scorpioides TaxID=51811 RepID=A0ABY6KTU8_9ARAC|nr:TMEM62 [Cordylochernes scorpioides]
MRLNRALQIKLLQYANRHDKVILQHDNTRPHAAAPVKTYLETLKWEVLPHPLGQVKRRCSGDSTSKWHSNVGSLIAFSLNRKLKKGPLPVKNKVVNLSEEMKFGTAIGKNFLNSSLD